MEEGELEVFYRSSEIRTLVKTRSMQLATNEKRPLNLCRKKKKKKRSRYWNYQQPPTNFNFSRVSDTLNE